MTMNALRAPKLLGLFSLLSLLLSVNAIYTPRMMPNETMADGMDGLLDSRDLLLGNDTSISLPQTEFNGLTGRQFDASMNPIFDGLTLEEDTITHRDIYSPKITSLDGSISWVVGSTVTVSWDTRNPPKHVTNRNGRLVLGHLGDDGDENLDLEHPLADDFDIMQGSVQIKVPHVSPSDNYILVLFGDSGNRSPTFTIN